MSDRLDKLRQLSGEHKNITTAMNIVNSEEMTFAEKFEYIQILERNSTDYERSLFGDVYSTLTLLAKTEDDRKLISGG